MSATPLQAHFSLKDWFRPQGPPAWRQLLDYWSAQLELGPQFFSHHLSAMPDPMVLKNLPQAVELLLERLQEGKEVLVLGDYDVDGVTSTALLVRFLRALGFKVQALIPNRFSEGYGLTEAVVKRVLALKPQLVVTVDNGITAGAEVAQLKAAGVEVIVTDHHLPVPGKMPDGLVVNPKQADCPFEEKDISGVGLAFMLLVGLRKKLREQGFWVGKTEPNLLEHLDLVALGTVADQVPLRGLNRLLTHHGLEQMRRRLREPQGPGAQYLSCFSQAQGLHFVDSETLAFRLAPLLNAAGRMDDAGLALDFLLETEPARSQALFDELTRLNGLRKRRQQTMAQQAVEQAAPQYQTQGAALVYAPDWHEGLLGIVATRLVEQFGGPALVCTQGSDGRIKGSARSKGAHMLDLLTSCAGHLDQFGGHAQAAGCTFKVEQLEALRLALGQAAQTHGPGLDPPAADVEINPEMIGVELVDGLKALEPFGQGNKKPVFLLRRLPLNSPRQLAGSHLKWDLGPAMELIRWDGVREGWGAGDFELTCTLSENRFRGKVSLQLIAQKMRAL
ncbi:MAG: single-stranded-DNA-specific exonuclease RecJ [bacterium]|nr:single-stranded-DNA-specific exonuclease RecJ [bacterium]